MISPLNWVEPIFSSAKEENVLEKCKIKVCPRITSYCLNIGQGHLNIALIM